MIVGTLLVAARAEARGRDAWIWFAVVIYPCSAAFVITLMARQVHRLHSIDAPDVRLIGWACGSLTAIAALRGHGAAGWRSALGSPVVGVFLANTGAIFVLVDQRGIGLVDTSDLARVSIGHRGRRRWILLEDEGGKIALRLWRHNIQ
jgi:hypothetical protein